MSELSTATRPRGLAPRGAPPPTPAAARRTQARAATLRVKLGAGQAGRSSRPVKKASPARRPQRQPCTRQPRQIWSHTPTPPPPTPRGSPLGASAPVPARPPLCTPPPSTAPAPAWAPRNPAPPWPPAPPDGSRTARARAPRRWRPAAGGAAAAPLPRRPGPAGGRLRRVAVGAEGAGRSCPARSAPGPARGAPVRGTCA
jgi:hypothetical protein